MSNRNFLLVFLKDNLQQVETDLRTALPAELDVRLLPLTEHTAILRGHLVDAFRAAHPDFSLAQFFAERGCRAQALDDEQVQARVASRSPVELPERQVLPALRLAGLDWHLALCNVGPAWHRLGGPDNIGWTTRVGQLDTGYTRHPVFGFGTPKPWLDVASSQTFIDPPPDRENWLDVEPGGGLDPLSGFSGGHGTRIASTICGHDPQASGGSFYGVAPRVPLVMARVADSVLVTDRQTEMVNALRYLVETARVDVINISLGFLPPGSTDDKLKAALSDAYEAGVIVVCAAGNYVDPVFVPARLNRTVAVAGVTRSEVPWSGSSFGPQVDFSAPAADLRRANVKRGVTNPKFSYGNGGDGTSYASAMTTGGAALWLQHRGAELSTAYSQPWQRVAAFRHLARECARVPTVSYAGQPLWQSGSFGTGILDVDALLVAPLPPAATLQREPQP
jgi:hypothetical protein